MRVEADRSSISFVYPFLFSAECADAIVQRFLSSSTSSRDGIMKVWDAVHFETEDWLPHLSESLRPTNDGNAIVDCFEVTNQFLQSRRGLNASNDFLFSFRDKERTPVVVRLDSLRVCLFRNGIGMIVQRWKLKSDHPADWLDFQHYGHFCDLERGGQLGVVQLSLERVEFPDPFSIRSGQVDGAQFFGTFEHLNRTVLESAQLVRGGKEAVRDVFVSGRFLPYTIVFLRESGDPDWPCEKVIYKLRRMHHAMQAYCPAPEQLRPSEPFYLQYLRDQLFFFSLEGGGFVASDASRDHFFQKTLPSHLETSYFLIFLIALQQRFALIAMSADVARHWKCETRGRSRTALRKVFERTRDRLFEFTARYYFLQVVQRENHHLCYQRWQAVFETRALYDEVSMEVHEMSEYLRDVDRQAREDRMGLMTLLLTVLIGAPSLAIGFWNINIEGFTASEGFGVWAAIAAVGGLSTAIALVFSFLWAIIRFLKNSDS